MRLSQRKILLTPRDQHNKDLDLILLLQIGGCLVAHLVDPTQKSFLSAWKSNFAWRTWIWKLKSQEKVQKKNDDGNYGWQRNHVVTSCWHTWGTLQKPSPKWIPWWSQHRHARLKYTTTFQIRTGYHSCLSLTKQICTLNLQYFDWSNADLYTPVFRKDFWFVPVVLKQIRTLWRIGLQFGVFILSQRNWAMTWIQTFVSLWWFLLIRPSDSLRRSNSTRIARRSRGTFSSGWPWWTGRCWSGHFIKLSFRCFRTKQFTNFV